MRTYEFLSLIQLEDNFNLLKEKPISSMGKSQYHAYIEKEKAYLCSHDDDDLHHEAKKITFLSHRQRKEDLETYYVAYQMLLDRINKASTYECYACLSPTYFSYAMNLLRILVNDTVYDQNKKLAIESIGFLLKNEFVDKETSKFLIKNILIETTKANFLEKNTEEFVQLSHCLRQVIALSKNKKMIKSVDRFFKSDPISFGQCANIILNFYFLSKIDNEQKKYLENAYLYLIQMSCHAGNILLYCELLQKIAGIPAEKYDTVGPRLYSSEELEKFKIWPVQDNIILKLSIQEKLIKPFSFDLAPKYPVTQRVIGALLVNGSTMGHYTFPGLDPLEK